MELIYNIKEKFESLLSKCQESITFISGYVTIEAFDFVESIIRGKDLEKRILFKLNLEDFKRGASSFDFRRAIDCGWKIYVDNSVHAKTYIFDDKYVLYGSANLTSKGLGLREHTGHELMTLSQYTESLGEWIELKFSEAIYIDDIRLDRVGEYIQVCESIKDENIKSLQEELEKYFLNFQYTTLKAARYQADDKYFLKDLATGFKKKLKSNPMKFAERLDRRDLDSIYKLSAYEEWYKDYIIDLSKVDSLESFDYSNDLYRFTPRIYLYKGNYFRQCFYDVRRNKKDKYGDESQVRKILYAINHLLKFNIHAEITLDNVILDATNSIKFIKFKPFEDREYNDVFDYYKNELKSIIDKGYHSLVDSMMLGG
ncbi:MAG: hypothetical protein GX021_09415 [Tissierellia bacterium]|mgnify:CR=1 FL=1|jgi:hypothetical protein|nr:hypothetical protein [Tissierellia bacterium]